MHTAHETDRVIAAVGDDEYPLSLMPENAFYQNPFGNNNPEGISPAWISFFPDLAFDSRATIGFDGPSSSFAGEEGVTMLFASGWESVFGSRGLWRTAMMGRDGRSSLGRDQHPQGLTRGLPETDGDRRLHACAGVPAGRQRERLAARRLVGHRRGV